MPTSSEVVYSSFTSTGARSRNSSSPSRSSPGRASARNKVIAVDGNTSVPESIYMSMLQAAKAMEDAGQHKLVCEEIFLENDGDFDISNYVGSFERGTSGDSAASNVSIGSRQRLVLNGVSKRRAGSSAAQKQQASSPTTTATTSATDEEVGDVRSSRRIMSI
eukprot:CAMPEP_0178412986 /NCGR_PEP_ID=MMETSP0689_2-20121128/22297_1 /TAXON_ID=160604 /ORGANISM="Amphidinium massartii, Strain CS-259" /LENGTH=162 /DNA_ID=CAMNT_0020034249 /DNA_START=189 /DNA_END=677 /DNA_ORIENTATION=-